MKADKFPICRWLPPAGQERPADSPVLYPVSGDQTEVEFTKKTIQEPLQWTAETPNLYTLVVSLKRPNGDVIEATSCKVGFRTVEIKDKQLLVNGQPILVKGVNYHEHNEDTGHYVSED